MNRKRLPSNLRQPRESHLNRKMCMLWCNKRTNFGHLHVAQQHNYSQKCVAVGCSGLQWIVVRHSHRWALPWGGGTGAARRHRGGRQLFQDTRHFDVGARWTTRATLSWKTSSAILGSFNMALRPAPLSACRDSRLCIYAHIQYVYEMTD